MASDLEELESAVATLERVVGRLEPGTLDVNGAKRYVDLFTRSERLSVAGRGLVARRVEQAVTWRTSGHQSAAHWLSSTTGESVGTSARALETARRLEGLPETADAFRVGELSAAQASAIAEAATLDPAAEHRLLETVRGSSSFKSVRDACREVSMRATEDRAKARWLHETRAAHAWTDHDGHWRLDARLSPDDAAGVASALALKSDEVFRAARARGQIESRAAYVADALVAICTGDAPRKPLDARLHADQPALDRGYAEPGERCELEGIGPIPVTMARAMLDDARVTVVGHDEVGDITSISSLSRTIPAKLRRYLEEAYRVCGVQDCTDNWRLEIDHIVGVEDGGPTEKDNLWRICRHHHKLKTYYGYRVVGPPGQRTLVAPDAPDPPLRR